eukprot:4348199-Prymnesium_polylepis.1
MKSQQPAGAAQARPPGGAGAARNHTHARSAHTPSRTYKSDELLPRPGLAHSPPPCESAVRHAGGARCAKLG